MGMESLMKNESSVQKREYIIRPYWYMPVAVSASTLFMGGLLLYSIIHNEHWFFTVWFSVMSMILCVQAARIHGLA